MRIFRRQASEPDPNAFWDWWAETGRALTSGSVSRGEAAGTIDALGSAVAGVHPELSWEIAPGELSAHVLVVTAAGNPDLRASARRWLLAAPPSDETWSYSDHRLPRVDPESVTLPSVGAPVDFAGIRVTARLAGPRFDVVVHHPGFAALDAASRLQVAFLALDLALGEYDVELWIGDISTTEHSLIDGFGLSALRAVVHDLKADHVDQDGQPSWALLQGETPAGPLLASAQIPLHPVTAPHLSVHVAVLLPYVHQTPEGLPEDASLQSLRQFEDRLGFALGPDGRVVAHQTSAGARLLHLYVDEASDAVTRVQRAAHEWSEGTAAVQSQLDPSWQGVQHLSG
jgi:hypothetical protein